MAQFNIGGRKAVSKKGICPMNPELIANTEKYYIWNTDNL